MKPGFVNTTKLKSVVFSFEQESSTFTASDMSLSKITPKCLYAVASATIPVPRSHYLFPLHFLNIFFQIHCILLHCIYLPDTRNAILVNICDKFVS